MNDSWFTVESPEPDTFIISEYQHWEETHCYLLCGTKQAVLIDTGLGVRSIRNITDALTSLPVLVVTTHAHWDHIGGHALYSSFAVHEAERNWLTDRFPLPLQAVKQNLLRKPCSLPDDFSIDSYSLFRGEPQMLLHDGDCLDLGGRSLSVLHTPGHSPGHCCFYEPARDVLYSGDLLYLGCLDAWYPTTDPTAFHRSVRKAGALHPHTIRPGHHSLSVPSDFPQRVDDAFLSLSLAGKLRQGAGIFDFGDFSLHI